MVFPIEEDARSDFILLDFYFFVRTKMVAEYLEFIGFLPNFTPASYAEILLTNKSNETSLSIPQWPPCRHHDT